MKCNDLVTFKAYIFLEKKMAVNFDTSPKVKVKVGKDFPYYIPEALGLKRSLRNRVLVGVVHLDKN